MRAMKGFKIERDQSGTTFVSAEGTIEGEAKLSGWFVEGMSLSGGGWRVMWNWWIGDEFFAKDVVVKDLGFMHRVSDDDLRATLRRVVGIVRKGKSPVAQVAKAA